MTIDVKLSPEVEGKFISMSRETGTEICELTERAIQALLDDRDDYLDACEILDRNEPTIPSAQVRRELGLDD
jgi:predicted DNA-binding protein